MLSVRVIGDEVILNLSRIPAQLREILKQKYSEIFDELRDQLKTVGTVGKYLDSAIMTSGVEEIASAVVGYIEYKEKETKYPIVPKAAAFLQFRSESGGWVRTQLVMHPYPKATKTIEQLLLSSKPWILDQLTEAIRDI